MKPLLILTAFLLSIMTLITNSASASEKTNEVILRKATSPLELSVNLSKDIYRSEPYQAEYDVQVPYETEETYYDDVPYQETESYIDYETYYESEYKCHSRTEYENVCSNEQRCHTVNEPDVCNSERVCRPGQGRQVCENVEECGTNAHGERICKTRQVCRNEPGQEECHDENRCRPGGSRQECSNEYVCHQVPREHQECSNENICRQVPHERQECGYEQVEKSRPVTKYRTVTKYRQEARTRPVTKYRTETRCCITQYRNVFDHQANLQANVLFPVGSELLANEQEQFLVTMTDEVSVDLKIQKSIFGYAIQNQTVQNGVAKLILEMKPKFTAEELGKNTLKNLVFTSVGQKGMISFTDLGLKPRVETKYSYQVQEKETGKVLEQGQLLALGKQELQIPLQEPMSDDLDYTLSLIVERNGLVLTAPVSFVLQAVKVKNPFNPNEFSNADLIQSISIRHSGDDSELIFEDKSPLHPEVKTIYAIEIQRKGGFLNTSWKSLASGQFTRTLKVDAQGRLHLSLKNDFHINNQDLQNKAGLGSKLKIKIRTTRTSPRLNNGQAIVLEKEVTAKVE